MDDRFFSGPTLAIETSCDETSAAIVCRRNILSNVVSSQTELHLQWGGIVPEAAARAHVEAVLPVIQEALTGAQIGLSEVKAVAVTNRPGLVGALSVGVTAAKSLALALDVPLIGVHHLEGHLLSVVANADVPLPHVCLLVSGGHTELVHVRDLGAYEMLGQTLDDAAGEAFDKSARLLGLPYPGGRAMQELAMGGNSKRYPLPRGLHGDVMDFSFSGLKTAVRRLVESEGDSLNHRDAAASIQEAIVSVLAERAVRSAQHIGAEALTLAGGVAANAALRERLANLCEREGITLYMAPMELCTDNAAMIGLAGNLRLCRKEHDQFDLDVLPNAPLP